MSYRIFFLILSLINLLPLIGSTYVEAADTISIVERPEEELVVVALDVNGTIREEGIVAYLPSEGNLNDLLVPLGELSDALTFSINVNPVDGTAEGFFIRESNRFQLDLTRSEVLVGDARFEVPAGSVEAQIDDIFVTTTQLSKWFGYDITFQINTLILRVVTPEPLPFQEKAAREDRAKKQLKKIQTSDQINPEDAYLIPYETISKPSFVVQESPSFVTTEDEDTFRNATNVQGGFDFLGFGTNVNLSYVHDTQSESEFTDARLTFQRRDPKRNILGPLKAGRVEIGDINFPPIPLFLGNQRGSGVLISSDPELGFKIAQQLDGFLIDGDAPVNWDVELYRNGQFIDFQTIGTDGRFSFDADLANGFNRFQIILFGPEGQKETLTRDVFTGPNRLAPGELNYNIAIGQPQSNLLPFAEEDEQNESFGAAFEAFYGISELFTVGGALYTGPEDTEDETSSASLSANASFLGLNAQLQGFFAEDSRNAFQAAVRAMPLGFTTALTHTQFNNFMDEDEQELESSTEVFLGRNFGPFNATLSADQQRFIDQEDRLVLEALTSTQVLGANISNTLTRTIADSDSLDDFEGELTAVTTLFDTRLRTSLSYDLDPERIETLQNLQFSTQNNFENDSSLRLTGNYDFLGENLSTNARFSKQFEKFTLDFDLGASTTNVFSTGLTLRFGLQPDEAGDYDFVSPRQATLATLGLRAFIDLNGNEVFDDGEQPIENVKFSASKVQSKSTTDDRGRTRLFGLTETPTRISVDTGDIPSIYLVPSKPNLDVIPRRGSEELIDFAFTQLGEIDGFVVDPDGEAIAGIPVMIRNTESGEELSIYDTEFDGYFIFTSLPLDTYDVIASYDWFDDASSGMDSARITLTPEKPFLLDLKLTLPMQNLDGIEPEEVSIQEIASVPPSPLPSLAKIRGLRYPPGFVVQLGSYKNTNFAKSKIHSLRKDFTARLETLDLFMYYVEVWPKDFYNRIYTETMPRSLANILCQDLKDRQLATGCLVVKYPS